MNKKVIYIIIGIFIVFLICACFIITANKFVGLWKYDGDKVEYILDNKNGNVVTETKEIECLKILKNKKYELYLKDSVETGTYSTKDNKIILVDDNSNMVIDTCYLNKNKLECSFFTSFTKE